MSIPSLPTLNSLKSAIKGLLDDGTLSLGEPCSPYTIIKCSIVDGQIQNIESDVWSKNATS